MRAAPGLLAGFDRIVVATGARLIGFGDLADRLLDAGVGHWPGVRRLMSSPRLRDWFYDRLRRATGDELRRLVPPAARLQVIGDAARPGKAKEAIASAFEAALQGPDRPHRR